MVITKRVLIAWILAGIVGGLLAQWTKQFDPNHPDYKGHQTFHTTNK